MNNKSEVITNSKPVWGDITGWLFGMAVLAIGILNSFWGNDPGFGVFLVLLSFVYFPPVNTLTRKMFGFSIPLVAKIILGVFILWAAVGVGELFDKIDIMMKALS